MKNSNPDSNYFTNYGLEKDPFPLGVIDKNIFLTPEINRRLKQVKEHITESHKLLIVTSAPGAGKTLLAQKLLILKEADWRTALVSANANMEMDVLSYELLQQLVPEQNIMEAAQSTSMLHRYLEQSFKEEIRPVIVIDNAELLPKDTLQFILQLADLRYNEALFRIVLFANDSIRETLTRAGLRELTENAVDFITMPGFSPEQIRAYLNYRFSFCGKDIELPFTEAEIGYLYKTSGGLPGGINYLSRRMMQEAIGKDTSSRNYGGLSVLLSVFMMSIAAYLFYENQNLKNLLPGSGLVDSPIQVIDNNEVSTMSKDMGFELENKLTGMEYIGKSTPGESLSLKLSEVLSNEVLE